MIIKSQVFVFIIYFLGVLNVFAAEKPAEYAYGAAIEATGSEAIYEVTLPANVYRGVTRRDLGDVRVFNGAGEVVPHAWRSRRTAKAEAPVTVALTLFPLKAETGVNVDGLTVSVRRGADGSASVDVKSVAGATTSDKQVVGYLIDLSNQEGALRALELDWKAVEGFSGKLRIDGSDDLARWQTLEAGASLMNLEVAGQRLRQNRVELPPQKVKYLRLSWLNDGARRTMPELTGASAELAEKFIEAPREWLKASPIKSDKTNDKPGEYLFDLQGQFPVDRLRIELPDANTIVQVELLTRDRVDQPWRSVVRGVVYRLRQSGGEIVSPDLSASASSERYWLLRVDQRGGGIGNGMPVLNAGWVPHQLVFAARGSPPFTLAYGNAGNRAAQSASYAIETLIPGYREDSGAKIAVVKTGAQQSVNVQAVTAQPQQQLGGEARLREQPDWKRWSLWGVLLLGVLVLGVMAWRLMKQLGSSGGAKP